jgi:sugar lactone lactonase YvrE
VRLFNLALSAIFAAGAAIPTSPAPKPAGPPTSGIVTAENGTVYFMDSFHRTVWRVQPGGRVTAFVTGRNGKSLQIDADGNIYGTHEEGRGCVILWRADPAGIVTDVTRTDLPEQHGHAFVLADGEVIGWTGSGKRTGVRVWRARDRDRHLLAGGEWGYRDGYGAAARFFPIGGMTRTLDGQLYVTSGPTIRKIAHNGAVTTVAAGDPLLRARSSFWSWLTGDVQGNLTGIAVDDDGTIYVANAGRDAVIRVTPNGHATEVITSDGGWTPTGVAAAAGVLYVLEYGSGVRVRRVSADGATSVVALVRPDRVLATHVLARGFISS